MRPLLAAQEVLVVTPTVWLAPILAVIPIVFTTLPRLRGLFNLYCLETQQSVFHGLESLISEKHNPSLRVPEHILVLPDRVFLKLTNGCTYAGSPRYRWEVILASPCYLLYWTSRIRFSWFPLHPKWKMPLLFASSCRTHLQPLSKIKRDLSAPK